MAAMRVHNLLHHLCEHAGAWQREHHARKVGIRAGVVGIVRLQETKGSNTGRVSNMRAAAAQCRDSELARPQRTVYTKWAPCASRKPEVLTSSNPQSSKPIWPECGLRRGGVRTSGTPQERRDGVRRSSYQAIRLSGVQSAREAPCSSAEKAHAQIPPHTMRWAS